MVTNDVSARQIQLTKTQFYEAKSYPTFTPAGPWLALVDAADLARLELAAAHPSASTARCGRTRSGRGHDRPARPGADPLSRFQPLAPGDLLLTGTPGGTALKAPAKAMEKLAGLLPPAAKWQMFFRRQAANPRYLRDGDLITATIASPDGELEPRHPAHHRRSGRRHDHARRSCRCRSRPTSCCWMPPAAWPDAIATQWIPDPACLHRLPPGPMPIWPAQSTRIANGLASLGVRRRRRGHALRPQHLRSCFAATLAAQAAGIAAPVNPALGAERIAELIRRTGSRILVAAGPEADPPLWQRLVTVARRGEDERHPRGAARRRHPACPPALAAERRRARRVPGGPGRRPALRQPDRDQPPGGGRSGRVRAHRRDHRSAEDRRAYPRQPAGLRPGDRREQPAWPRARPCWAGCRCSTSTP